MDREICADCGKEAPQTETNYTLISAQFGWRLTRGKSPSGEIVVEWRCPACWREYKRLRPGASTGNGGDRASVAPPAAAAAQRRGAARITTPPAKPSRPPSMPAPPAKRPSTPTRRRP